MALEWCNSCLTNRKQFVAINNAVSSDWDQNVGVPQGSLLGPILYVLYMSPVTDIIKSYGLSYLFYADDCQLYIASSTAFGCKGMHREVCYGYSKVDASK